MISAQNTETGDVALLDFTVGAKHVSPVASCALVGTAVVVQFAADSGLSGLVAPTIAASANGPVLTVVGLTGLTIEWACTGNFGITQ